MIHRLVLLLVLVLAPGLAAAQSAQENAQLRLYVQQLEEQVRALTGEVERLRYELQQAQQTSGATSAGATAAANAPQIGSAAAGAPPQSSGTVGIAENDPLIAPDGATEDPAFGAPGAGASGAVPPQTGGPIDLSTLAGGAGGRGSQFGDPAQSGGFGAGAVPPGQLEGFDPNVGPNVESNVGGIGGPAGDQTAMAGSPPPTVALSGSARDEYDLAYGYILTGDYDLAEQSFRNWLASFPQDQQAVDARFWLGESLYQQGEYREAANAFLDLYKQAGQSAKGPDALIRLGMSLSQLGEKDAACGTLSEFGRRFPEASANQRARVDEEMRRAGCA